MSLFFLVLSIAFFLLREFRQSIQVPVISWAVRADAWSVLKHVGTVSPKLLEKLAQTGERQRDARTLAFAALHHPEAQASARLADRAITLDPQLTWVYWILASRYRNDPPAGVAGWRARLRAWDPDNAVPYLLEAEHLLQSRRLRTYGITPEHLEALSQETAWREIMEKAFAAPRYDTYTQKWFELERSVLSQQGLDTPAVVLLSLASYPVPSLLNTRDYVNLLVLKRGKEAEQAGRLAEAAGHYWKAAHFAERMHLQSRVLIEKLIASALQLIAYERLGPLLRRLGRSEEAAGVNYALDHLRRAEAIRRGQDPLAQSSNYNWAALMVHIFAGLVVIFAVLTAVAVIYVNAKRWVRPERKGRLYQLLTVAENYLPIVLFLACLGLYISYYPFAQNFHHYMTATGEIHDFEPLVFNTLPAIGIRPFPTELPLENPFLPYAWYALAGVGVVLAAALATRRRAA